MLQCVLLAIVCIVKFYVWFLILTITVSLGLAITIRVIANRNYPELSFKLKIALYFVYGYASLGVLLPIIMFRPRHLHNSIICAFSVKQIAWIIGLTCEVRNYDRLECKTGAVICCNHQSPFDLFNMINIWFLMKNTTVIVKRELLLLPIIGQNLWLSGFLYINRKSPKQSHRLLNEASQRMANEKLKIWIFPEGTINKTSEPMMPFKKGAFISAIDAQVPIIPVTFSPYYFLKDIKFEKGHMIISVLKPIPTVGLTLADVDKLMEQTRNAMLAEYSSLCSEINSHVYSKDWQDLKRPTMSLIHSDKQN